MRLGHRGLGGVGSHDEGAAARRRWQRPRAPDVGSAAGADPDVGSGAAQGDGAASIMAPAEGSMAAGSNAARGDGVVAPAAATDVASSWGVRGGS